MSRYTQRLSRLSWSFGLTCPIHAEALVCPQCASSEPLPRHLARGMSELVDSIVARAKSEALTEKVRRVVKPSAYEPCADCGCPRHCVSCDMRYGHELMAAAQLTDGEQQALDAMLAECRRLDRERRGYDEL